ncbi:unnamed protein product [Coregonus sp. 'balchen']|nr:unnamed protein product [Coregonus sp. 'balchen']
MQAPKPESWSPVLLSELQAQGNELELDRKRLGQSNCLKRQGSLVVVLAHVPRSERCGEGGGTGEELWLPLECSILTPLGVPSRTRWNLILTGHRKCHC